MSIDNLAKARTKKYITEIGAMGQSAPDTTGLGDREAEAIVKEFRDKLREEQKPIMGDDHRQLSYKGEKTEEDRVVELEAKLAEVQSRNQELYSKFDSVLEMIAKERGSDKPKASNDDLLQDPRLIALLRGVTEKKFTEGGLTREGYIDPSRRLEHPVTFFVNKSGIQIRYRTEAGIPIALPDGINGPLKFRKMWRDVDQATQQMTYRGYMIVADRALAEWLRKHEDFGTVIFESEDDANRGDANVEWSNIYQRYMTALKHRPEHSVIEQAKGLGYKVNVAWDGQKYRELVAKALADEELKLKSIVRAERLKEAMADKLLSETGAAVAV